MMGSFVAGNLWLIVALVLLLGKNIMRGNPTRYSFFGVGGWYSPGAYWLMILVCAAMGVGFMMAARRNQQTDSDSEVAEIWPTGMAGAALNGFLVSGVVLGLIGAMLRVMAPGCQGVADISHVSLMFGLVGGVLGAIVAVVSWIIRVWRGVPC